MRVYWLERAAYWAGRFDVARKGCDMHRTGILMSTHCLGWVDFCVGQAMETEDEWSNRTD